MRAALCAFLLLASCVTKTVEPLKEEVRKPKPAAAHESKPEAAIVRVRVSDLDD
ncbi:MAG TPA: hypothetical protein VI643_02975 [Planctomycetota bacterium]|nr:hypothetical protein [Planctomycetota bacterium]